MVQRSAFTVELRITNRGTATQADNEGPEVFVKLSPELTGGSCSATKGVCRLKSGSRLLSWNGSVGVNETVTITFGVQVVGNLSQPSIPFCLSAAIRFDSNNDGSNESVNFPRTTPPYSQAIASGRTGWMRIWAADNQALLGAVINFNPDQASLTAPVNGGHNLHKLTLANAAVFTIPVFPPSP